MHQIEDTDTPRSSRREFCVHACQAASFVAATALLQACSGNSMSPSGSTTLPTINASAAAGAITLTIDAASPLAAVGSAALLQSSAGNALVSRTAQDTFTAVTAVCTHEACTVPEFQGRSTSVHATVRSSVRAVEWSSGRRHRRSVSSAPGSPAVS